MVTQPPIPPNVSPTLNVSPAATPSQAVEPPRDVGVQLAANRPWRPPFWPEHVAYPNYLHPTQETFPPIVDPRSLPTPKNPLPPADPLIVTQTPPFASYTASMPITPEPE